MDARIAVALSGTLTVAACALFQSTEEELREEIVETALDQVGEDYEYGGADPDDGFDCSGLVYYSYAEAGIELPRSAAGQRRAGRPIKLSEARPGDLLFYNFGASKAAAGARPAPALHVVIYLGDAEAVHAPVRDGEVEVIRVTDKHWRQRFVGATRIIRAE